MEKQIEKQAIEEMAQEMVRTENTEVANALSMLFVRIAEALYNAGYRKQTEGEWVDNHCTNCGMTPIGDETWTHHGLTPPRFELFMSFCPNCGAHMKGGAE